MFTMPQLEFLPLLDEITPKAPTETQLELELKSNRLTHYSTVGYEDYNTSTVIAAWNPPLCVSFNGPNNKQCGKFSWDDGIFRFDGEAEPSAKLFAEHIAKFLGMKLPA